MKRTSIPLKERPFDIVLLIFFIINLVLITYLFDIEQLVIIDTSNFQYPVWPPRWLVDLSHWYGKNYDPLLMARPPWWRATIWIDALFFGPFYAFAIYAYYKGKDWIRFWSIIWASVMLTNVTIILFEETIGPYASPNLVRVVSANLGWILVPLLVLYRMWKSEHPFTREIPS